MGDEAKLKKLKQAYLDDLHLHAGKLCLSHKKKFAKCMSESVFNYCGVHLREFTACAKKTFEELKEENKEILEFKINPSEEVKKVIMYCNLLYFLTDFALLLCIKQWEHN